MKDLEQEKGAASDALSQGTSGAEKDNLGLLSIMEGSAGAGKLGNSAGQSESLDAMRGTASPGSTQLPDLDIKDHELHHAEAGGGKTLSMPDSSMQTAKEIQETPRSEAIAEIEKWTNDQNGKFNHRQLADKLVDFANKSESQWKRNPDATATGQDIFQTYTKFTNLFLKLNQREMNRIKDQVPWTLRPGE